MSVKLLDVVKLAVDIPAHGLKRGDLAAVVELYQDDAVEAEFVLANGFTKALLTLTKDQFSPLDPQDMLAVRRLDAA
ncbi:MAG TPA: DUF4926 domain-containing protein [Candidatus Acidoferrum sp.]|nr:DUF4926 domain-containing protein [Candidatus Acidoferrum sp.]